MAKRKKTKSIWWLIAIPAVVIIFLAFYSISNKNAIIYILKPLQFNSTQKAIISEEAAVSKVKALPEVIDYLKQVPNGLVLINGEEDNAYMIQVYEIKNGHTATFNWYRLNKKTGKITKEF